MMVEIYISFQDFIFSMEARLLLLLWFILSICIFVVSSMINSSDSLAPHTHWWETLGLAKDSPKSLIGLYCLLIAPIIIILWLLKTATQVLKYLKKSALWFFLKVDKFCIDPFLKTSPVQADLELVKRSEEKIAEEDEERSDFFCGKKIRKRDFVSMVYSLRILLALYKDKVTDESLLEAKLVVSSLNSLVANSSIGHEIDAKTTTEKFIYIDEDPFYFSGKALKTYDFDPVVFSVKFMNAIYKDKFTEEELQKVKLLLPELNSLIGEATAGQVDGGKMLKEKLNEMLSPELSDVEAEAALHAVGIYEWGPEGDNFQKMFAAAMNVRSKLTNIN